MLFIIIATVTIGGSAIIFGNDGPIFAVFLWVAIFIILLTGIQIKPSQKILSKIPPLDHSVFISVGPFLIQHCHHSPKLCKLGKEIRIGKKYFCIGCYGACVGGVVSLALYWIHLSGQIPFSPIIYHTFPLWFVPIMLRYTVWHHMRLTPRLMANICLPIGCALFIIFFDAQYQSCIINIITSLVFFTIVRWRVMVGAKENQGLEMSK